MSFPYRVLERQSVGEWICVAASRSEEEARRVMWEIHEVRGLAVVVR